MIDLITYDRNLYIKGKRDFKTTLGGIFTIIFLTVTGVLLDLIIGPSFVLSAANLLAYEMSANEISQIPIPPIKIIYGLPKVNISNLEVIKILDGPTTTVMELHDYSDDDWNLYFNFSKDPSLVYKFHNWIEESAVLEVVQKVILTPTNIIPSDWYCYPITGWKVPIRLNEFGDSECLSTDGINSDWGQSDNETCHKLLQEHLPKFKSLSCGVQHLMLWGITGYETPTHWCATSLKTMMSLSENQKRRFLHFDFNLTFSRIFVAVEQRPFNEDKQKLEYGHLVLSSLNESYNWVIAMKRSVSKISLKK